MTIQLSEKSAKSATELLGILRTLFQECPTATPESICNTLLKEAMRGKDPFSSGMALLVLRSQIAAALDGVSVETFLTRMEFGVSKVLAETEKSPVYQLLGALMGSDPRPSPFAPSGIGN